MLFVPLVMDNMRTPGNTLTMIGRLKPGVTWRRRRRRRRCVSQFCWSKKYPQSWGATRARPMELKEYVSGKLRRSLIVLWCAVGLILLIVCVNLSNLLLARAAARSKEFAMRSALGAGRGGWCGNC